MEIDYSYQGLELELFAHAKNWNTYLASLCHPYMKGNVLEVGAGQGNRTSFFLTDQVLNWLCLEPDVNLVKSMMKNLEELNGFYKQQKIMALQGNLQSLLDKGSEDAFDTIVYLDVLEHIEDDREEISQALLQLRKGGHLIVLAPAHSFLYTAFDKSIGHYRRYQKSGLRRIMDPQQLVEKKLIYVDSWGLILSLSNKLIFKKKQPLLREILFWDRCFIPLSRLTDPILFHALGKSILGIWQKL